MIVALLLLQWQLDYSLLAAEDARADASALVEALKDGELSTTRQALRALGRFERPALAPKVVPFLEAGTPELRIEAANALAQMKAASGSVEARLGIERTPAVRAALYEALGRFPQTRQDALVPGLDEREPIRFGAAKGLENLLRKNDETPSEPTLHALRKAVRESGSGTRQLGLLALNRAGDRDPDTLEKAWQDPDPLVRRLAILGLFEWHDDPSPIVRYAALKVAPSCALAKKALADPSEHVVLLAIDTLGELGCPSDDLERPWKSWRRGSHALVALAKIAPGEARRELPSFVNHPRWQARVYAAKAAQILEEHASLSKLGGDANANVVAAALVTTEDALDALGSDHYGLLMAALGHLEGVRGAEAVSSLEAALYRVSRQKRATSRDPRRLMLERLRELGVGTGLEYLLDDFDPEIARLAASVLSQNGGKKVTAKTEHFAPTPLPPESILRGLSGARARISMKESGPFVIELLPEAAPITSARFAALAESGYYDGLTFHRIVVNFVLQGGSPGANEYVGASDYLRDELGLVSHERGTLGISTRGRDTGDAQIFVNLVNNYRLDHNYTVFARVVEGMESVDRIQEGDVMTSVEILRR